MRVIGLTRYQTASTTGHTGYIGPLWWIHERIQERAASGRMPSPRHTITIGLYSAHGPRWFIQWTMLRWIIE